MITIIGEESINLTCISNIGATGLLTEGKVYKQLVASVPPSKEIVVVVDDTGHPSAYLRHRFLALSSKKLNELEKDFK